MKTLTHRSLLVLAQVLAVCLGGSGLASAAADGPKPTSPEEAAPEDPAVEDVQPSPEPKTLGEDTVLPWNRPAADAPRPPTKRLSSAREMLTLFGIDESQINQFYDNRPLDSDEDETLLKILYRMPFFGRDKIEAWRKTGVDWSELADDPDTHRIEIFKLDGRATHVRQVDLLPEIASRFEYKHYFLVRFQLADAPHPVTVCCRHVPEVWPREADISERSRVYGLFLKVGDWSVDHPELIFAAERVAWLPDRVEVAKGVTPSHVILGSLGMDVGLFDDVREANRKALGDRDREGFYQLLAAAGRAQPSALFDQAEGTFELEPMLNRPETQHGRLVTFTATARRIQRIIVDDEDIQQRFGIDHYYQVDLFVPLGDQEVRLGKDRGDKEAPVFTTDYPVTCCMLRLPKALQESDDVNQQVRVAGFYFKLWAVKTDFVTAFDKRQRQPEPLFIGTTPRIIEWSQTTNPIWGWIGGASFLVVLLGIVVGLWFFRRSDRRFEEMVLRQQYQVGQGKSLDEMGFKPKDGPDFSNLE